MTTFDEKNSISEEAAFSLEDGEIHVRQDGPRDARALVLIHGSGASLRSWYALTPSLARSHRVIRVDLLGHGRSAKPQEADYGTAAQAHRVSTVLDRLGVGRALFVGHSSGGYTATAVAEHCPELVDALALINTGPRLEAFTAAAPSALSPQQWPPDEARLHALASGGFHAGFEVPQVILDDVRAMTYHSFLATMQASTEYLRQRAMPQRLGAVKKPVLVIFGVEDARWRSSTAIADYREVAGATVEAMEGVGHSPIVENPAQAGAALLDFIAAHSTAG